MEKGEKSWVAMSFIDTPWAKLWDRKHSIHVEVSLTNNKSRGSCLELKRVISVMITITTTITTTITIVMEAEYSWYPDTRSDRNKHTKNPHGHFLGSRETHLPLCPGEDDHGNKNNQTQTFRSSIFTQAALKTACKPVVPKGPVSALEHSRHTVPGGL
jgi:hypothetical protein